MQKMRKKENERAKKMESRERDTFKKDRMMHGTNGLMGRKRYDY